MGLLRTFLGNHRAAAALLVALALAIKALVPAGYMAASPVRMLSVSICADASGGEMIRQIAIPLAGQPDHAPAGHGKAEATCPYAALGMAALGGADAPLLVLALAFILVLGLFAVVPPPARVATHLRPPLRGPPANS